MNPSLIEWEPGEVQRVERVIYARWLTISPREWDKMSYGEQCDIKEIKRAFDENSRFDRKVKR